MTNTAKLFRQQALLDAMTVVSGKITRNTQLLSEFWQVINQANLEIAQSNVSLNKLNNSPITSDIVVTDVFEGTTATNMAAKVPASKDHLKSHQDKMHQLVDGIRDQISLLENHIGDLNSQLADLQNQLYSLD